MYPRQQGCFFTMPLPQRIQKKLIWFLFNLNGDIIRLAYYSIEVTLYYIQSIYEN